MTLNRTLHTICIIAFALLSVPRFSFAAATSPKAIAEQEKASSLIPIRPGEPGVRPFWNQYAKRFIYAPAFDIKTVDGAVKYRFTVEAAGKKYRFETDKPWAALSPIWNDIPEGDAELTVRGLDAKGKNIGIAGKREFYRAPTFSGEIATPPSSFKEAGRLGLKALFEADHVQNWLKTGKPDPNYPLYCYPAKVIGGLLRGMVAYSRIAEKETDRKAAEQIARRVADHIIEVSFPSGTPFEYCAPTYTLAVNNPTSAASNSINEIMVAAACDAAFGYLDLFDACGEKKYFDAAQKVAATYAKLQANDGTWPLKADIHTGKAVADNRLVPTWVIYLFDRLDRQYGVTTFRDNRKRAWDFIVANPLRTFQWDGQFEDVKPRPPYRNLAREQACDVAVILLEQAKGDAAQIATAKELLNFSEDQFVVWSPFADLEAAHKLKVGNRNLSQWITPCVLEQYACYGPVARSSAVLINAYLVAHKVTGEDIYLQKARALTGSLVFGQRYQMEFQHGNGEVPTWLYRNTPKNWLNNSYYAAAALLQMADAEPAKAAAR